MEGRIVDGDWTSGWNVLRNSLKLFRQYPSLLLPILAAWAVYVPNVLYLKYGYDWKGQSIACNFATVFLVIFLLSFSILLSCAFVLCMLEQIEKGRPPLSGPIGMRLFRDGPRILVLSIAWALIWFALNLLEVLLSRRQSDDSNEAMTAQNAAETIANYRSFSFSAAFVEALQKGVRMVMFLILPAIVWEDLGTFAAAKKGLAVLRAHLSQFGVGYALTYAASGITFLPAAVMFWLGVGRHGRPPLIHFPDAVWVGVIFYVGFAWSLSIYLEQMFMAQLYLWHMKWDKEAKAAIARNQVPPPLTSVSRPDLLQKLLGRIL